MQARRFGYHSVIIDGRITQTSYLTGNIVIIDNGERRIINACNILSEIVAREASDWKYYHM